ncbi:hypothetical protein L292_2506 [Acinetobacter junii CIP 107470 = MTCC 11364]|uniref:Uncharacterized protein n=1 Tax=Acinetobacter junii CIP 107470 = MTCC 11364 TaxID=1217666 RepID=S7WTN6_ACIJU|nr:hypothetical protein [Acinetobacter junii]ENV50892.1 hypothetical protein F953_01739 [Acinetobacter junii CIP 107470 = MTCC 11364]EPR86510.1 hypothetical protein L292_2506 [Acinetobacter junii CIP 107470 = MTCC 11364]MDH1917232.1 hypothetical protein [Acinetobacter junii]
MFDVDAKFVKNPTYNLIMYMNKYCEDKITKKVESLFGNLQTHFNKLFCTVGFIHEIQKDEEFMRNYNKTGVIGIQNVEYCYYKISTIFDIAYQIADILVFPKNKEQKNRYHYLESKFIEYSNNLDHLNIEWYKNINLIRNKITHGGIKVTPFYIHENPLLGKRLCFQAYNLDLDDLTVPDYCYSNSYNNYINFSDNYFAFHTHALYCYLKDFFDFIMFELNKNLKNDINDLTLENDFMGFGERNKKWVLSNVDTFLKITKEMIFLDKNEGLFLSNDIHKNITDEIILTYDLFKILHDIENCFITEEEYKKEKS